jgi:hypothetical protein
VHPCLFILSSFLEVTGGDRARVVLAELLHGGFSEGMITESSDLQERFRLISIAGVNQREVPPQGFSEDHTGTVAAGLGEL